MVNTYIKDVQLGGLIQQKNVITQNDRTNLEQNGFNTSNKVRMRDIAKELLFNSNEIKIEHIQTIKIQ